MKAKVFINQKAVNVVAATGMLLAMLLPAAFPMLASAAVLDSRSIAMSTSEAGAGSVSYDVTFTTASAWKSVIIDFCGDSPIPGQACSVTNTLGGFDAGSATDSVDTLGIGTPTVTASTGSVKLVGDGTAGTVGSVHVELAGIHNPTAAGAFYARIYTYNSTTPGWTDATNIGSPADTGGIALEATTTIGVSAAVRESLTFCLSGSSITTCASGLTTPDITLGHGTPAALDSSTEDTAQVFTQIATNAAHGATVYMKNSNACGGLSRDSGTTCDIAAAGNAPASIGAGDALFGMLVGTATGITPATAYASGSQYGMNYVVGGASGVTSAYGDPIYDTTSGPLDATNVPLTFAAGASNTTPAGLYKANMNLVATGTF